MRYREDGRVVALPTPKPDARAAGAADVARLLGAVAAASEEFESDPAYLSSFLAAALPLDEARRRPSPPDLGHLPDLKRRFAAPAPPPATPPPLHLFASPPSLLPAPLFQNRS